MHLEWELIIIETSSHKKNNFRLTRRKNMKGICIFKKMQIQEISKKLQKF